MIVRVIRSPLRLLAYALVAVPMILLALDMLFSYHFYPYPETTVVVTQVTVPGGSIVQPEVRAYTPTGLAQRRRDVGWGIVLLAGGSVLLGWSFSRGVVPRRLLAADAEGLSLWLSGRRREPLRLAWEEVAEVRSGIRSDEAGEVPVLSLRFQSADRVPISPRGAVAEPPWLHLFAGEWDRPAHEVAALIEGQTTAHHWEAYG